MTAKEYLNQARLLDRKIKSLQTELGYLNELASGCNTPSIDGVRVQKTADLKAPFIKYIDKIFEMEKKIEGEIEKLMALKEEISSTISEIGNPQLELILRERYVNCRNWETISESMGYSLVYLYKMHKQALTLVKTPKEYSKV